MNINHTVLPTGVIRRSSIPPWELTAAKERKQTCRNHLILQNNNLGVIEVFYSKTRFWKMDEGDCQLRKRTVHAWIDVNRKPVGTLEFHEFDLGCFLYNEEFRQTLDNNARIEAEMADTLLSCWDDIGEEIGDYGTILDFRRAWMHPSYARGALWVDAFQRIMEREFAKRSLLVMKAFPLEYEGCCDPMNQAMRNRRQKAMIRHYKMTLGVAPLPGRAGEEGWLFQVPTRLLDVVTQPSIQGDREFSEQ